MLSRRSMFINTFKAGVQVGNTRCRQLKNCLFITFFFLSSQALAGSIISRLIEQDAGQHLPADVIESIIEKVDPSPDYLLTLRQVDKTFKLASERLMVKKLREIIGPSAFSALIGFQNYEESRHLSTIVDYFAKLIDVTQSPGKKQRNEPHKLTDTNRLTAEGDNTTVRQDLNAAIIFSPRSSHIFLTVRRSNAGFALDYWDTKLKRNRRLAVFDQAIRDVFFFYSDSQEKLMVLTQDYGYTIIESSQPNQLLDNLTPYTSQLLDTYTFSKGKFQILVLKDSLVFWRDFDLTNPIVLNTEHHQIHAIKQNPNKPHEFILSTNIDCKFFVVDIDQHELPIFEREKTSCLTAYLPQEPERMVMVEHKPIYQHDRIEYASYLTKLDLETMTEIASVKMHYNTRPLGIHVSPFDKDILVFTTTSNRQPVIAYEASAMRPLKAYLPTKKAEFVASFFGSDSFDHSSVFFGGSTDDPLVVMWNGIVSYTELLEIYSLNTGKLKKKIKAKRSTYFPNAGSISELTLNPRLLLVQEQNTLKLLDTNSDRSIDLLKSTYPINEFEQNPYFPHVIIALSDTAYFWDFFAKAQDELLNRQ